MLTITSELIARILEQGQKAKPLEACGYLAGIDGQITEIYPLTNIDQSPEHFSLDPKEQFAAIKAARGAGLEILAVYHTHPQSPARPSAEDIRLAYGPNIIYLIVSLLPEEVRTRAFKITNGQVTEEKLTIKE